MSFNIDEITENGALDIAAVIVNDIDHMIDLPIGMEAEVSIDDYQRVIVQIIIRS